MNAAVFAGGLLLGAGVTAAAAFAWRWWTKSDNGPMEEEPTTFRESGLI